MQQSSWQSQSQYQAGSTGSCQQLPRFQPMAFVVFSPQAETQSAKPTPLRTALPRDNSAHALAPRWAPQTTSSADNADASGEQALTLETFEGELPSIGSAGHFDGSCKRCAFYSKGRCQNGKDCTHCHFAHEPRSRLRKRAARRGVFQAEAVPEFPEVDATEDAFVAAAQVDAKEDAFVVAAELNAADMDRDTTVAGSISDAAIADVTKKDDLVSKLNNALMEATKAYSTGLDEYSIQCTSKGEELASDGDDIDTTPSASALSDAETGDSSETSDSENGSVQESKPTLRKSEALTASRTAWRSRKACSDEDLTTADIERMTRSLLNKLTEDKFEALCEKILHLPLTTAEHLAVVAAEIFAKATTQDCFRTLYTKLCMRLDAHLEHKTGIIGGKAFRKALVNACQASFERNLQPADAALFLGLNDEECFEVHMKLKTRRLGNMRFIGDLLLRRLLAPKLLPPIVHELLGGDEDKLESLIALLTIVAPEFEAKPSLYQAPLRDAFQVLRRKNNDKSVCPRMKCQITDLFDAKARSWAPRTFRA